LIEFCLFDPTQAVLKLRSFLWLEAPHIVSRRREPPEHLASEWFEFVVEVAKTSFDSSAKQETLASPTTKVSTIGLAPPDMSGKPPILDLGFRDLMDLFGWVALTNCPLRT